MAKSIKVRFDISAWKINIDVAAWERNGYSVPPPFGYKQQVLRDLAKRYKLGTMIESGTYFGQMDFTLKDVFSQIYTIELVPHLHAKAKSWLAKYPHIDCILGDSSVVIPSLLNILRQPCLFWLDAHYSGGLTGKTDIETPISFELDAVLNHTIRNHVVLIDDARLFDGTNGYPLLSSLRDMVICVRPDLSFAVKHDIIIITPKVE
jgi:hypothetical protein